MRIRITKPLAGILDGHSLGHFAVGLVYELDDGLARQLISMGCARAEGSDTLALVIRDGDETLDETRLIGGVRVIGLHDANDATTDRRQGTGDRRKHPRSDRRKTR